MLKARAKTEQTEPTQLSMETLTLHQLSCLDHLDTCSMNPQASVLRITSLEHFDATKFRLLAVVFDPNDLIIPHPFPPPAASTSSTCSGDVLAAVVALVPVHQTAAAQTSSGDHRGAFPSVVHSLEVGENIPEVGLA